jgi:predicted transcriptional regulator
MKTSKKTILTPLEEQLMRHVWQANGGFIRDLRKMYPVPLPPYTSVATLMKKLEAKGYVSAKRYSNIDEYTPVIQQDDYKKASMAAMVSHYFQNSYKEMVTFFAKEENLTEEDLQEVIKMIKK